MADYDAVVIGSGMGGGTAAAALADGGLRTLVVERGTRIADPASFQDEAKMLIEGIAADDRPIQIDGRVARPFIGGIPGGSTALFGAALLRPSPEDFEPGRHYGDRIPPAVQRWPFQYEDLAAYYDRAEELFRVSGDGDARPPHLGRRGSPYPAPSPPLDPFNEGLSRAFRRQGLEPFRLPLAIDVSRCRRCPTCPGYVCPNGSRASTESTLLRPRAERGALEVWEGQEAECLVHSQGRVRAVRLRDRASGVVREVRAEHYLLAAGALGTPVLLERSGRGLQSGQLGRNHMCHLGALAVAIFARPIGADRTFLKRLGLSDFYLGTRSQRQKLGSAQTIPIPGPLSLRKQTGMPLPMRLSRAIQARSLLLAGYVEDLPQATNRVRAGRGNALRLERRFAAYDVFRARILARALVRALRGTGARVALPWVASGDREHLAHQVGTCRAGDDPRTSVVDGWGRLHDDDRIWVVDGSVFPTSLGVGPALTIAAHALRVADRILGSRFRSTERVDPETSAAPGESPSAR
jgi:choline dehydrogenase-like flavoprotein